MNSKSVGVYSLLNPELTIKVNVGDKLEEVAPVGHIYTLTGPRRVKPSQEPEKSLYKKLQAWAGKSIPKYAAVVNVQDNTVAWNGVTVVEWNGKKSLQGNAPFGLTVIGTLSSEDGVHQLQLAPVDIEDAESVDVAAEPATCPAPVDKPYTGDPFIITEDGRYMDMEELKKPEEQRFSIPRNFEEFYAWKPNYIRDWVRKRIPPTEDVEDWTQDLVIHLKYLPHKSKHRLPGANGHERGCRDVIETFNPYQQYGASERRFRNYLNRCLVNKFLTLRSKNSRNPIQHPHNLSFDAPAGGKQGGEPMTTGADEFIHTQSTFLLESALRSEQQTENQLYINEFKCFLRDAHPSILPTLAALEVASNYGEGAAYLGISEAEYTRRRNRLKEVAIKFAEGVRVRTISSPRK
jgi:hypothetical protein